MSSDKTKEQLDAITNENRHTTDATINSIRDFKDKHQAHMHKAYGRFCEQFELYHSVTTTLFHHNNYGEKGSLDGFKALQFSIAVNSQISLYSAYELFLNGMYDDSIAILRIVYESFLRIVFISIHQDYPYNAIIRNPAEGPKFNATALVDDQLKLDWTHYGVLSNFVHGNSYRVFLNMEANADPENPKPITVHYKIDEDMISLGTNYFYFLMLTNLWLAVEQFKPSDAYLTKHKELGELYSMAHECRRLAYDVIATHTANKYWQQVAVDLNHIFKLIENTPQDQFADWKDKWTVISKI